ncbi:MAG: hypothetical protein RR386_07160 [Bacteroidaceae bacterium]
MKTKKIRIAALYAVAAMSMTACSNDDNITASGPTNDPDVSYNDGIAQSTGILFANQSQLGNGNQEFVFTGKQTIQKGTYTLKGWVYVAKGAELTIEPGTVIKGDKETKAALIVERGGKAYLKGTATQPIVMTSEAEAGQRKPGDWGGLIICGNAKNNQGEQQIEGGPRAKHGGTNDADNSGIFQFIRVEFAGYPFQEDKEINGVTFGSVGSGTTIDHVQVSYSNDDSFEWFGGSVNCKNLIAYKGWDDDFDTDNGFSGQVQFGLSIRDPRIADTSQSNGFESDNNADGSQVGPYTKAVFSNITLIGPATQRNADFQNKASYINAGTMYPDNNSKLGLYQSAIQIRRSSKLNVLNSVAVGYPIGVIIDGEKGATPNYAQSNEFQLKNIVLASCHVVGSDRNKKYEDQFYNYTTAAYDPTRKSLSNQIFFQWKNTETTEATLSLTDPRGVGQNYCPTANSPLLSGASFPNITNGYLNTTVNYIGAFSGINDTWMDGWTNFDPQHTAYK